MQGACTLHFFFYIGVIGTDFCLLLRLRTTDSPLLFHQN